MRRPLIPLLFAGLLAWLDGACADNEANVLGAGAAVDAQAAVTPSHDAGADARAPSDSPRLVDPGPRPTGERDGPHPDAEIPRDGGDPGRAGRDGS